MRGDFVIKMGFFAQIVFLLMVDGGTIHAMRTVGVADIHYVGIVVVNVVCLSLSFVMWRWLREQMPYDGRL